MTYNGNFEYGVKDKIEKDINGLFICPFCSKSFRALAYHTRQVHNVNARELRTMFHLPMNYSLQTKELKELRRKHALENNMDQQLIRVGQKTRFKKGYVEDPETSKLKSIGHKKKINYHL